jgi:hypothetical protein
MLTRYGTKKIVRVSIFSLAFLVVAGYAIFASHDFLIGPAITVTEPQNGATVSTPIIKILGKVERIKDISLNDRLITIDDVGNFNESVLLAPGYNIFIIKAHDKFGRSKDYRLEIIYKVN